MGLAKLLGLDLKNGRLPPWLAPLVHLTKPMATTLTALVIPLGAFSVAMVAAFWPERALNMATASTTFLAGIPDSIVWMIGGILGISFASSTAEVIKGQPGPSPNTRDQDCDEPEPFEQFSPPHEGTQRPMAPPRTGMDPENMPARPQR